MKRIFSTFSIIDEFSTIYFARSLIVRTDVSLPTSEEMIETERGQFHQKQNLASVQAQNDGIEG